MGAASVARRASCKRSGRQECAMSSVTNRTVLRTVCAVLIVECAVASRAAAQTAPPAAPPAPPEGWSGSAGLGLALNRGNTSTSNLNVSVEATDDPKTGSVWKLKGLYLRGENNGQLAVDRLLLEGRNERALTERAYAFGQLQYLEDEFKAIDYLFAPSVGAGYKVVALPATTLSLDGGVGIKWE